MAHQIKIEPQGKVIKSDGKETIKDALEKSGIYFPMNCGGAGTCSNCRVEFLSEAPKIKRIEAQMFGKDSHYRMACIQKVESDCEISLPVSTEIVNVKNIAEVRTKGGKTGFGFAIDLGTTTVAIYLVNLQTGVIVSQQSFLNPQNTLGGDVMSRLKVASQNDGLKNLHNLISEQITIVISEILLENELSPNMIHEVSIAGNSVMTHLFLGLNASGLEHVPFISTLQEHGWLSFDPEIIGLPLECSCRLFPVLYSFIGGDTGAAILAHGLDRKSGISLLVDLGTNGEIVLAIEGEIYATSAAAGPAFDGMGMHSGMPALLGAIEGVSDDGVPQIIGDSDASGICGSGYISLISYMLDNSLLNYSGLIENVPNDQNYWTPVSENSKIHITQEDIRKYQLAKGAVAAGIEILCSEAEIAYDRIDEVIITGSFGNRVNTNAAMNTGLIPKFSTDQINFVDNSAGRGAILNLGSSEFYDRMLEVKQNLKVINLGDHPKFQDAFVQNMLFPFE